MGFELPATVLSTPPTALEPFGTRVWRTWMDGDGRANQVRAASVIGLLVGSVFSLFNLLTEGMLLLGWIELAAVLFLVLPAAVMSLSPSGIALAENLMLLAGMVIFSALVVLGGVEGTGLFWVYTLPFLAFFLKGQRQGWWFSLSFVGLLGAYFWAGLDRLPLAHNYSPVVITHFLLSLCFYTVVAAAFNHVRSRFEAQLQQRKAQAEAAYLAKSRFLAAASHDLRQPAHALGMFVARLSQLPQDAPTRELVAGVDASVRALQDMLDSFFDYSRLDTPAVQVRTQAFPVAQLLEQLHTTFAGAAAAKGLRLHIRPSALWLHTDPALLQRVLLNLLGNAVQYTQRGRILVACRPLPGHTHTRLEVWDTGIGIDPAHHTQIFDEFFQICNPERDRGKGLGLGLSIVQRSCRLLEHPLSMQSVPGRGTRFTVMVPLAAAQTLAVGAEFADASHRTELQGLQVLLIEDDALSSLATQSVLASWGCRVSTAAHAQAACDLLRTGPAPDFIVSDYRLPGAIQGVDAVRQVRALLGRDVPACVISGDTDLTVRAQVEQAGLVLLQKPVRPAKLRSVLRHHLQAQVARSGVP